MRLEEPLYCEILTVMERKDSLDIHFYALQRFSGFGLRGTNKRNLRLFPLLFYQKWTSVIDSETTVT